MYFIAKPSNRQANFFRIDAYMRGMCTEKKIGCLSLLGAEIIAFQYFYISAFCSTNVRNQLKVEHTKKKCRI